MPELGSSIHQTHGGAPALQATLRSADLAGQSGRLSSVGELVEGGPADVERHPANHGEEERGDDAETVIACAQRRQSREVLHGPSTHLFWLMKAEAAPPCCCMAGCSLSSKGCKGFSPAAESCISSWAASAWGAAVSREAAERPTMAPIAARFLEKGLLIAFCAFLKPGVFPCLFAALFSWFRAGPPMLNSTCVASASEFADRPSSKNGPVQCACCRQCWAATHPANDWQEQGGNDANAVVARCQLCDLGGSLCIACGEEGHSCSAQRCCS